MSTLFQPRRTLPPDEPLMVSLIVRLGGLPMRSVGLQSTWLHFFLRMHLLYLDDAGSATNRNEEYLVLGGVSVYEAQAHWITQELDRLAEFIHPADPHGVEFHASETFARRVDPWKRMSREEAQDVMKSVLDVLRRSYDSARTFACAVHKASFTTSDPMGWHSKTSAAASTFFCADTGMKVIGSAAC